MRLKNSIIDSIISLLGLIISGIISFVKISIIVKFMGNEINGLNNLLSKIFNFLMISEAGLGLATRTLLYKTVVDKDIKKSNKIISGSQIAITIIISIVLIVASFISIFIPIFIKDSSLNNSLISIIFILFSIKAIIPQFLQPLKAYVAANQENYLINVLRNISLVIINCVEIYLIISQKSYIYVLIGGILSSLICEFMTYIILKRKYKFINIYGKERDFSATKSMKELIKVNMVSTVAQSVDPLIISRFIGIITTSFYSNYSYVQNFIQNITNNFLGAATNMFGNMFAKNEDGLYEKFNMYIGLTNFMASTASLGFYALIKDFIQVWVGKESVLDIKTSILFSILIYMYTAMRPINTLVYTNGFFRLASKSALYETIINTVLSIILVNIYGMKGVLMASIISYLLASFWFFPIKTYKIVFNKEASEYFKKQTMGIILFALLIFIISFINIKYIININCLLDFIKVTFIYGIIISFINFGLYVLLIKDFRNLIIYLLKKLNLSQKLKFIIKL